MPPITAQEWTSLLAVILLMVALLWMLPSCGDQRCVTAHTAHMVGTRAEAIEKRHAAFHGPSNPDPGCGLCVKRPEDA